MHREIWRWVVGYEGLYMVSNMGNVKRVGRARGARSGRVLKASDASNGYLQVVLSRNSDQKICRIHRLVAEAFLEKVDGKDFVNHIDGDKKNNRAENLEWCTKSENALHSYRVLGNRPPKRSAGAYAKKIDASTAVEIFNAPGAYRSIAREFGISDVMVRNIKIGKCWRDVTCPSTE